MIELEKQALTALAGVSMRMGSSGKRFRNDMCGRMADPDYKLTERQALYLWFLVYTYRRQITAASIRSLDRTHAQLLRRIVELGTQRKMLDELPGGVYLEGDLRDPVDPKKPKRIPKPETPSEKLNFRIETQALPFEAPPADTQNLQQ